jgi:hypothetical protein
MTGFIFFNELIDKNKYQQEYNDEQRYKMETEISKL